MSITHLLSRL